MRTIYTDAETAGVVQSEIDKAGLGGELEVKFHPWVPFGAIVVNDRAHPWHLIANCYAGLRVLLND